MPQLKLDPIEGTHLRRTSDGFEARRVAFVAGLSGSAADRLRQAMECQGVPRVGDAHPTIAGLHVSAVDAEPDGATGAKLTIHYRPRPAGAAGSASIEVGSSLLQVTARTDREGNPITVAHSPTGKPADLQTQSAAVAMLVPQITLRFMRIEQAAPTAKAQRFVGTVNRSAVFDGAAGTWLCTGITGRSSDGGRTFEVCHAFQHKADGWQPTASFVDPRTNRVPVDAKQGVGVRTVKVYREMEFRELGF